MYQEKKKTMRRVCKFAVMMLMSFIILHNNTSLLTDVSAAEPTRTPTVSPNPTSAPSSEPKKEDKAAITPSPTETLPDIEIFIDIPDGYFSDKAVVTFSLKSKDGSMPKIQSVKAKAGKDGKYQDVTTTMRFEITEDCTVHVVTTDTDGRTYERSRKITCFDKVKPTLNASVSEGILEVVAKDDGSGVKSIIVNGYEYTDHKNGKLTIRLSQFDASYDKFVIQATDNAGNTSDKYNMKNPYKKNKDSNSDYDPATELPVTVTPTENGDATGEVTGHIKTDKDGNVIKDTPKDDAGNTDSDGNTDGKSDKGSGKNKTEIPDNLSDYLGNEIIEAFLGGYSTSSYAYDDSLLGREFYTISTESGKIFYLIIDRTSGKEVVRFLTDITEEDLLHVTKNTSESLPRNSAAKDSSIPITEAALPNNNTGDNGDGYSDTKTLTEEEKQKLEAEQKNTETPKQEEESFVKKNMSYIIMGVAAVIFIILGYYFKVVKKRREGNDEESEDTEDDSQGKDTEDEYLGSDNDNSDQGK